MTLKITKRTTRRVPVTVVTLKWFGPLKEGAAATGFKCSACGSLLGARRFATGMIDDGGEQRGVRLCDGCGRDADDAITAQM